ncbi:hypothetical protein D3C78_1684260 [compost metagenome]
MARLPSAPALGVPLPARNLASSAPSTSVTLRVPVSVRVGVLSSSVTAPLSVPPITAESLTPVMVMVTVCSVPSTDCTVKVSTLVSPSPRYCTLLLSTW